MVPEPNRPLARGRGSQIDPPIRFGGTHHELDLDYLEHDEEYLGALSRRPTEYPPTVPGRSSPRTTAPTWGSATASTPIGGAPTAVPIATASRKVLRIDIDFRKLT
jgi:hypothetical protein